MAFSKLSGVVVGPSNTLYVADSGNNTIYTVDLTGQTATVWAGTTGTTGAADGMGVSATFNNPTALAIDASGNVYVADTANSTIRRISSSGAVTTLAGVAGEPGATDGVSSAAHFNYPQGVAVDSSGNVYIADSGNATIRAISPSGNVTTIAGLAGTTGTSDGTGSSARFENPTAIVINSKGTLCVTDVTGSRFAVRAITPGGVVTTVVSQNYDDIFGPVPNNLAIDSSDDLFFILPTLRQSFMTEITPDGGSYDVGPIPADGSVDYDGRPSGMTFDQAGRLFTTEGPSLQQGAVARGPQIISQPQPVWAQANQTATFTVVASASPTLGQYGFSSLSYQWYFNGVPVGGGGPENFYSTNVNANTVGTYSVVISNGTGGAIASQGATLTFLPPSVFTGQPANQAVQAGAGATFSAQTTGLQSPTYRWTFDGNPIAGATSSSFTLSNVQVSNSGAYAVTATDPSGNFSSQTAFLTVSGGTEAPAIGVQPQSYTINIGRTVVLSVGLSSTQAQAADSKQANATTAPTFQWFYNGNELADGGGINGSQTAMLVLSGTSTQSGSYVCLVENSDGSVLSNPANLNVTQATDIGRLVNVSCRANVGTGANILIAGFAVGGAGTSGVEPVLVRGAGPALIPFGVSGTLFDPELQLFSTVSGSSLLATNSGWEGNANVANTAAAVGAFPWSDASSQDSALTAACGPGPYTANISGKSGDAGVALAEVYDATPEGSYTPLSPRLVNLSARVAVGTGADILIAGFIVGGSTATTVLIRASGPALGQFGVAGLLPDPQLELFDATPNRIASNNGWGANAQIAAVAGSVGAFSWGAAPTPDSALFVTLAPGAYTAQVSGAAGDTGVALIEVYEVP